MNLRIKGIESANYKHNYNNNNKKIIIIIINNNNKIKKKKEKEKGNSLNEIKNI